MKTREKQITLVPIAELLTGDNPRQDFDQQAMAELMQSMKHQGLLTPIGVRKCPHSDKLKIVFGHRRYLAAQRLGWDKIETVLIEVDDEKDALLKTSTENVIRENVSMPEQGRIFNALIKKGLTSEQIAVRMGCSKKFVLDATDAFNRIPKKYHDKITYGTRGLMKKEGTIPATVALAAIDVRKKTPLTDNQMGQLMEWAAKHRASTTQMKAAGKMLASGTDHKKALANAQNMRTVSIQLTMKIETITKLQAKHKQSIHDIIYRYLDKNKELEIVPIALERAGGHEVVDGAVRVRKKAGRNR